MNKDSEDYLTGIGTGAASGAAAGSVAGPWGCVCAGTRVITNSGEFKNIEDITKEDGIIGWTAGNYTQQPIVALQDPAKKECLEIETRLGHIIQCSTDHPIYSSGQGRANRSYINGGRTRIKEYKFVDAEHLKLGDNIGLINEIPIWGVKEMNSPYLVGICIGDGTYGKDRGIRLFSADADTWNYIESNGFGYQVDKNQYTKYNKEFRAYRLNNHIELFRELGIYEQTKLNKRLPDNIHLYNKESVCKLIAGLIDTDGYVSFNPKKPKNGKIGFCQSNIELINQVREQLMKLGIHNSLKINKAKNKTHLGKAVNSKEAYVLIIKDRHSVINFHNNINLNISYKKENLNNLYEYIKNLEVKDHKEITNICADKVIKVTPIGKKDIYNLEAGGSHTYIANLIITHNTAIGGLVGGGLGALSASQKVGARNRRVKSIKDAKTYQGNYKPYENEAIAEENYKGLAQEASRPNQEIDLGVNRATTTAQQTGTSASGILSAISGIQAKSNEAKRGVAGDVQNLKDVRAQTLMNAKEGVMQDQQAVFNDAKQKQQAIIAAQSGEDAASIEQTGKTIDTATGSLIAGASLLPEGKRKGRRAKPSSDYMSKSDLNLA